MSEIEEKRLFRITFILKVLNCLIKVPELLVDMSYFLVALSFLVFLLGSLRCFQALFKEL